MKESPAALSRLSVPVLVLLAAGGCAVAERVDYVEVEPSQREGDDFLMDLGLLRSGTQIAHDVEFWNVSDRPWRMEIDTDTTGGVPTEYACQQEYDCSYVGPTHYSVWTVLFEPGRPGTDGLSELGVLIVDEATDEPLDWRLVRLQWRACGDSETPCPNG